jgi:hypothetical protein
VNSRHPLTLSSIIIGFLALAGCGVTGHQTASPGRYGHDTVSGTAHPSAPLSPSATSTAPRPTPSASSSPVSTSASAPTSSETIAKLMLMAHPNPIRPHQTTTISGTAYLADGHGAPHAKITILGIPHRPQGITVYTNAFGQFHLTAQWSQPGSYWVSVSVAVGDGRVGWQTQVVVQPTSSSPSATTTPPFAGTKVQRYTGPATPQALPNGYVDSSLPSPDTFSSHTYHRVEGFTGLLDGRPFVLDFYQHYPVGLFVGLSYNGHPVYFGSGPAPVFDVLNFTGPDVVLGMPSAGAYMALNVMTGHPLVSTRTVVALKGYSGLTAPAHILGLPAAIYPVDIPYGHDH